MYTGRLVGKLNCTGADAPRWWMDLLLVGEAVLSSKQDLRPDLRSKLIKKTPHLVCLCKMGPEQGICSASEGCSSMQDVDRSNPAFSCERPANLENYYHTLQRTKIRKVRQHINQNAGMEWNVHCSWRSNKGKGFSLNNEVHRRLKSHS